MRISSFYLFLTCSMLKTLTSVFAPPWALLTDDCMLDWPGETLAVWQICPGISSSCSPYFGTRSLAADLSYVQRGGPSSWFLVSLDSNNVFSLCLSMWGNKIKSFLSSSCWVPHRYRLFPKSCLPTFIWTIWGESCFLMKPWLIRNDYRISKKMIKCPSNKYRKVFMYSLLENFSKDSVVGWIMPPKNV